MDTIIKYSMKGYNDLVKEFKDESDQSVIILALSYLDRYLEYYLKKRLIDHELVNTLFEGYAPLNSLSAKIDVAFCVGIVSEEIHSELHRLRKIRNLAAHEDSKVNFNDRRLIDHCKNLISAKGIRTSSKSPYKINNPRSQFLFSVSWCMIHLETQRERIDTIPILKLKFEIVDDEQSQ